MSHDILDTMIRTNTVKGKNKFTTCNSLAL